MSVFASIQAVPDHGNRQSTITWTMQSNAPEGEVLVAFSRSGVKGSWITCNAADPVTSTVGTYVDTNLVMNGSIPDGFYKLILVTDTEDLASEKVALLGDMSRRDYGVVQAILKSEMNDMKYSGGYPVWHFVKREDGTDAQNTDPDTGDVPGVLECGDPASMSFGSKFQGGFYPPVLTWIKVSAMDRGTTTKSADGMPNSVTDDLSVRTLAWPRPVRGHVIVDPATDRRYIVGDAVKSYLYRAVYPLAYETTLHFIQRTDPLYKLTAPAIDTKSYRKMR